LNSQTASQWQRRNAVNHMRGKANGEIFRHFPAVIDECLKYARFPRWQPMAHVGGAFAYFHYLFKMILILNISRIVPSKERIPFRFD
jgi:hypothetical protein